MRRLILTTGLLAAALIAIPQFASAQGNQPAGGGGGQQQLNPGEPLTGGSMRPRDESIGAGEMRRDNGPGPSVGPGMQRDQSAGGGGGQQLPNPDEPRR
jgi:hypothetical protein